MKFEMKFKNDNSGHFVSSFSQGIHVVKIFNFHFEDPCQKFQLRLCCIEK